MLLMVSLSGLTYGAKEELKNTNGKYSGSASIGLVATGRVIERIPQSMLVLEAEDEKGIISDIIKLSEENKELYKKLKETEKIKDTVDNKTEE